MDSGVTEDFELFLISEILSIRDKFELLRYFQHLPSPQSSSIQCDVRRFNVYLVVSISTRMVCIILCAVVTA